MRASVATELAAVQNPTLSNLFRSRLEKLIAQRDATEDPKEQKAVNVAMFRLFLDCVDLGLSAEAQEILKEIDNGPKDRAVA